MADSQLDTIASLLFDHILAIDGLSKDNVNFQDVSFTPPRSNVTGGTKPAAYVAVAFTPNTSDLDGIAYDSGLNDAGLLGLNVVWPAGQGVLPAIQFAKRLVSAFEPGLVLYDGTTGVVVKVHEQPRVAPAIEGNDTLTIPVIVRWVGLTPKTGGN